MAVYDRWHLTHPDLARDQPCKCGRGRNRLYPSIEHGVGKRWQVRWTDGEGKACRKNFVYRGGGRDEIDPETYAEAWLAKVTHEVNTDTYIAPDGGRTLLRDYAARWRGSLLHRDSTAARMERVFRLHVDPVLGHLPIGKVKASHIRGWVKDRSDELAPSTLAVAYGTLASLFAAAVLDRDIGSSPCAGVRLPGVDRKPHYIPTPDQVHRLAENLPAWYAAMVYLAAGCGLRFGEVAGLEVDQVDFLRREVDVGQQLRYTPERGLHIGPPKTKTSSRTCELPAAAAVALTEHLRQWGPTVVELDDVSDPRRPTRRQVSLLFATPAGSPLYSSVWSKVWAPARDAAGIPAGNGLHALRHYFATLLIHQGASVKTVQMALGHANPMITLNEYVGEWPEAHERTRSIVDSALGRVPRLAADVR